MAVGIQEALARGAEYVFLQGRAASLSAEERDRVVKTHTLACQMFERLSAQSQAAIKALQGRSTSYTPFIGEIALREAIESWANSDLRKEVAGRILAFIEDAYSTELDLSSLQMDEEAFPEVFDHPVFARLEKLELSHNLFRNVPAFIQHLSQLKNLCLSHTFRYAGRVSWERRTLKDEEHVLSRLPQLERLDLSGNAFEELPDFLGDITTLKVLDISDNTLDNDFDCESCNPQKPRLGFLARLEQLEELDITDNCLENFPHRELEACKKLKQVKAQTNLFRRVDVSNLSSLEWIDLRNNVKLIDCGGWQTLSSGCTVLIEGTQVDKTALMAEALKRQESGEDCPKIEWPDYGEDSNSLLFERLRNSLIFVAPSQLCNIPDSFSEEEQRLWFEWASAIYDQGYYNAADTDNEEEAFLYEVAKDILTLTTRAGSDPGLKEVLFSHIRRTQGSDAPLLLSLMNLSIHFQVHKEKKAEKPDLDQMVRLLINGCWTMDKLQERSMTKIQEIRDNNMTPNGVGIYLAYPSLLKPSHKLDIPLSDCQVDFSKLFCKEDMPLSPKVLDEAQEAILAKRGDLGEKVSYLANNKEWVEAVKKHMEAIEESDAQQKENIRKFTFRHLRKLRPVAEDGELPPKRIKDSL